MKKFKHYLTLLIRNIILFAPGAVTILWLFRSHGWTVSILAALGVEFITGVIIAFVTSAAAQYKARREIKKEQAEESA